MKKINLLLTVATVIAIFGFAGCKSEFKYTEKTSTIDENASNIAKSIYSLREAGYFDTFLNTVDGRSVDSFTEDEKMMIDFITDTDSVLNEIENSEDSEIQLSFIQTMFNNGSAQDMYDCFNSQSLELADEFITSLESVGIENLDDIELNFLTDDYLSSRAVDLQQVNWTTVGLYTGYCVATIAGCVASCAVLPWVKVAGMVAATAGAGAMVYRIVQWNNSEHFSNIFQSIVDRKSYVSSSATLEEDIMISTIIIETTLVIGVASKTFFGQSIVFIVKSAWNKFISILLAMLPSGVNYVLWGIPLVLI